MRPFWEKLRSAGMMTGTKFNGLIIDQYDENTYRFYMKNQLMENSLLVERMTWILRTKYTESIVYGLNARLTNGIMKANNLYKIKDLNDMQQAYDAFLTAHIGAFVSRYLRDYLLNGSKEQINIRKQERSGKGDKNGVFIACYDKDQPDEMENKGAWKGAKARKDYLKTVYSWHDGYVSRKPIEYTGKFYNETIYRPTEGGVGDKHGSRKQINIAYMDVISYKDKDGEAWNEVVSVPAYLRKDKILDYIERELGFSVENGISEVKIVRSRVLLNQEAKINGHPYYLRSASEWINAKQLFIKKEYAKEIYMAMSVVNPWKEYSCDNPEEELKFRNAANYLADKFKKLYPIYGKLGRSVAETAGKINIFPVQDIMLLIRVLVNSMGTGGERIARYAAEMKDAKIEGDNRLSNKRLKAKRIVLYNRSVTGIYSTREIIGEESGSDKQTRKNQCALQRSPTD
jgi:CRISPR-associated endonuclease Csn1